jgi:hypothetical protein
MRALSSHGGVQTAVSTWTSRSSSSSWRVAAEEIVLAVSLRRNQVFEQAPRLSPSAGLGLQFDDQLDRGAG